MLRNPIFVAPARKQVKEIRVNRSLFDAARTKEMESADELQ